MSNEENIVYDLENVSYGVRYVTGGYIDYSKEVLINRALPNIFDGLKPVNRRITVTLHNDGKKNKGYIKCARIAGNVLALHPHGDASVYAAMVLMTQKNGSLAFPLVDGSGEFGAVYKTDPPAAPRYTEAKIHSNTSEYFGALNGVRFVPNFDATMSEPEVLPVSFPAVLVNSTSGIAVGFKSNIPSFNFNDICDLVTEYIQTGDIKTVIAPDFVTGGYYIKDDAELLKIMKTGKGKIKLRGKATIIGNEIQVTEVPYGKTIQGIIKQINDINSNSIRNAYDTDDFEHGAGFTVACSSKAKAEEALLLIYKDSDFQYSYSSDITVIQNGKPKRYGVWQIIKEWVAWRKEVLAKEFTVQLEGWESQLRDAKAFMTVVNDTEKKLALVNIIAKEGREAGRKYITENFTRDEVPDDLIAFVGGRALPDYHTGGKYAGVLASGEAEINRLKGYLDNLDEYILNDMKRLKAHYGASLQRKTVVTEVDYNFEEVKSASEEKKRIIDESTCGYHLKNGFLRKTRYFIEDETADFSFEGKSNDTLVAFDNRGRVLRVYCSDIPMYGANDLGMYIPKYCNLDESDDDYKITYIGRLTGETLMLLYKDGNIGFVDTSEWIGNNRQVKVIERGISQACADCLGKVFHEAEIPEVLVVTDTSGRLGWTLVSDVKRKDRTAKTRAFTMYRDATLDTYCTLKAHEIATTLVNADNHNKYMRMLETGDDWKGAESDFIEM